jgi:hypothetical protein
MEDSPDDVVITTTPDVSVWSILKRRTAAPLPLPYQDVARTPRRLLWGTFASSRTGSLQ